MSNLSRGKTYEREAIKILEKQDWLVEHAMNKTIYIKGRIMSISHDFFHMFDIIAKKPGYTTRWIQVSTWEQSSTKRKQLFSLNWTTDYDSVEIWARVRGGIKPGFRILHAKNGFEWDGLDVELVVK